jgi:hypothetical protein
MKKEILLLILIGILVSSGFGSVLVSGKQNETCKTDTIYFSSPKLSEKDDYIIVDIPESTHCLIGAGKPALPVVTKLYMFPFGTHIKNVEISYSKTEKEYLTKPIIPAPEPQIISGTFNSNYDIKNKVVEIYEDNPIYPEHRFDYRVGSGLKDGKHTIFLTVHLYPIMYTPENNVIYYSNIATIHITYSSYKNPVSFPDIYDLLIITPDEFTDELQPLVDYKNGNGIPTVMVTLDDIPKQGVDRQEDIKYFIKDSIETWGVTYVLLVGSGVEEDEKFPVRYVYCQPYIYEEKFPSDLYYADIYDGLGGFPNWDYDGDGRHVEYPTDLSALDIYPDVHLSRLPCNDADEVNTIVNKIINYYEHNKMTMRILQIGGDTHPRDADLIYEGEFENEKVLEKLPGYTTTRLWGSLGNLKKINIREGFMSGVDFVDICGHGFPSSISTHPPNQFAWIPPKSPLSPFTGFLSVDYDLFFFNNIKKLPVVVYSSCLCNKFSEVKDCIGWKVLSRSQGGGIASFGATTTSWGYVGNRATDGLLGWINVKLFEELYENKILGICWGNCITDYINSFSLEENDLCILLSYELFGDPTLVIEDGKDPKIKSYDLFSFHPGYFGRIECSFPHFFQLFSSISNPNNVYHKKEV